MNCRVLYDQALLLSRQLLLPTMFPLSYSKERILVQNYVATTILLHSISLHIPFKRVGSPLLILCFGSISLTELQEIVRSKFLLFNQPFTITMDRICDLFRLFSSDVEDFQSNNGLNNDEVVLTTTLCMFATLLLGYDVIMRGGSNHIAEELVGKIRQLKHHFPNFRTVLLQEKKSWLSNESSLQVQQKHSFFVFTRCPRLWQWLHMIKERFRTAIDVAVTVDYDANNTPHLQEMTWYLPAPLSVLRVPTPSHTPIHSSIHSLKHCFSAGQPSEACCTRGRSRPLDAHPCLLFPPWTQRGCPPSQRPWPCHRFPPMPTPRSHRRRKGQRKPKSGSESGRR